MRTAVVQRTLVSKEPKEGEKKPFVRCLERFGVTILRSWALLTTERNLLSKMKKPNQGIGYILLDEEQPGSGGALIGRCS